MAPQHVERELYQVGSADSSAPIDQFPLQHAFVAAGDPDRSLENAESDCTCDICALALRSSARPLSFSDVTAVDSNGRSRKDLFGCRLS
jgi:hypothetical protein